MSNRRARRRMVMIPDNRPSRDDQLFFGHFDEPDKQATQVQVYPWNGDASFFAAARGMTDARRKFSHIGSIKMTGRMADPDTGEAIVERI